MVLPETVTTIKPEMHILCALHGLRYIEHLPHYWGSNSAHSLSLNALYRLRLGTPILTSVQATANFLTLLVALTNTRWQVFFGHDTHTVLQ